MKTVLLFLAALVATASAQISVTVQGGSASPYVLKFPTAAQLSAANGIPLVGSPQTWTGAQTFAGPTVFGGTVALPAGGVAWAAVAKSGASLADLPTRLWSDLQSRPTSAAGLGVLNGATLDAWASLSPSAKADATALAAHVADTGNPHAVTKAQVGLGNVPNVDATNASNLTTGTLPAARLPATAVTPGTYGDGTHSLTETVGADGRLTSISTQIVTPAWSSITSRPTSAAGYGIANGAALDGFAAAQSGTAQNVSTSAGPVFTALSTFGASRPITLSDGAIRQHASAGLWNIGTTFAGSAGTVGGFFGAFGSDDSVIQLYLGGGDFATAWQVWTSAGSGIPSTTAATSTTTGAFVVGANAGISGNVGGPSYFGGPVRFGVYTVSTLPSASTTGAGATAYATDLTSTTSGATATGGGSGKHLVTSDGTNWIVQ